MHIGLFTYGSRGDVQPYIALALKLIDEGYRVTLGAPGNFQSFVESFNVPFYPIHGNAEDILYSEECQKIIKSGNNLAFVKFLFRALSEQRLELFGSILGLCKSVDAIVANNIGATTVSVIAEHLKIKMLILQLNPPVIETNAFPVPGMPFPDITWINKLSYRLFYRIMWYYAKKDIIEFRRILNLPASQASVFDTITKNKIPVIHAFSEELINRPSDWSEHHMVTGFLTLNNQKRLDNHFDEESPELTRWLVNGQKPVYIGFGSIPVPDPLKLKQIIQDLLNTTQERIIFCTGWSKVPELPQHPNLFVVSKVNHQWLFPQCRMVVIHGGIGTLTAALQAGIPVIVVSIFADQPIWGDIVMKKGFGLYLPWRQISVTSLKKAIHKINHGNHIAETVMALSKRLSKEDGAGIAVKYIKHYLETST
jgi:sterol 3beta-glucosyltransferase